MVPFTHEYFDQISHSLKKLLTLMGYHKDFLAACSGSKEAIQCYISGVWLPEQNDAGSNSVIMCFYLGKRGLDF